MPRTARDWLSMFLPVIMCAPVWVQIFPYVLFYWNAPINKTVHAGIHAACVVWALTTVTLIVFGLRLLVACVAELIIPLGWSIREGRPPAKKTDEDEEAADTETTPASAEQ